MIWKKQLVEGQNKRNIKEIGAWESITSFMNSIRKQDFVILVISDNDLKSVACMYEVMQLLKDDDWLDKTIIMLADDINIFGTKEQIDIYKILEMRNIIILLS